MIDRHHISRRGLAPKVLLTLCVVGLLILAIVFLGTSMNKAPERVRPAATSAATPSPTRPAPTQAPAVDPETLADAPVNITPAEFEFGLMPPGTVTRRTVQVRNTGTEPVEVTGTKKSCSCTTVELVPTVLQPGDEMPVTAVMTAGLRTADKSTVKVVLQYAAHKPTTIGIVGKVSLPVSASPTDVRMHPKGYDDSTYRTQGIIQLDSEDGMPFRVRQCNGGEPVFLLPINDPTVLAQRHQIRWNLDGYDPVTGLNEQGELVPKFWIVETDRPDVPVVAVPLNHRYHRAKPRGDCPWFTIDRYAVMDRAEPGGSVEFTLQLNGNKDTRTAEPVYLVESESSDFTASLVSSSPSADGKNMDLQIRITPAEGVRGVYQGDIILRSANWSQAFSIVGYVGNPKVS